MLSAPKYSKVELLIKENSNDKRVSSIKKIEFDDCGLVITGDYIIIVSDEKDSTDKIASTTGKIYHLNEIFAYKTYNS